MKDSIVSYIMDDLIRMSKLSIITNKELHSLVGKLGPCAGLLIIMRPFLEPMWAALSCEKYSGARHNCIWRKQVDPSLT